MSRAAEREHVSQPALSRQVKLLEEELGLLLFHRIKKRIHLTDGGKFFLMKARQILCDSESAIQQVQEQFSGMRRTLRLGFLSPFLDDLVAPVVREFQQRHSTSKVSLFDLSPRAQLDRLRLRELDLGILANLENDERELFEIIVLSRHRFVAVVPNHHQLADRKSIKLCELKNEKWVSLSNTFFPQRREWLQATCVRAGFNPDIVMEMDSLPMMLAEIGTGGGVGLMPGHAAKLPHAGCAIIDLTSPKLDSELLLVLPKENQKDERSQELGTLVALIAEGAAKL